MNTPSVSGQQPGSTVVPNHPLLGAGLTMQIQIQEGDADAVAHFCNTVAEHPLLGNNPPQNSSIVVQPFGPVPGIRDATLLRSENTQGIVSFRFDVQFDADWNHRHQAAWTQMPLWPATHPLLVCVKRDTEQRYVIERH